MLRNRDRRSELAGVGFLSVHKALESNLCGPERCLCRRATRRLTVSISRPLSIIWTALKSAAVQTD